MSTRVRLLGILISLAAFAAFCAGAPLRAEDAATAAWQVSKASGEVWVATEGVQPASLGTAAALKPGDSIRTGRNGRVLLVRGQETILVAPNSAIMIPAAQKDASSTTILQQAGSIRLEVEKRPERNFEVETPYLVAAVKGTQFTVTVGQGTAKVDVNHGSVEVADYKSGQIALVMPGQSAKVSTLGQGGLTLGGAGTLNPIRKGEPRAPSVQHLQVPKGGFSAPQGQHVRALGNPGGGQAHAGGLHIGALGEVKLDIHKVTNGLAHGNAGAASGHGQKTVWSTGELLPGNGVAKTYNQGNNGSGNGAGGANGNAGGNGNEGGNGNAGGNGLALGVGNGLALGVGGGLGPGGNGNGNGNAGGNGNGNNGKHLGNLK